LNGFGQAAAFSRAITHHIEHTATAYWSGQASADIAAMLGPVLESESFLLYPLNYRSSRQETQRHRVVSLALNFANGGYLML